MFSRFFSSRPTALVLLPEREAYCVPEVARALTVSAKTLYRACRRNDFPHKRVGRRVIIPRDALRAWLAG